MSGALIEWHVAARPAAGEDVSGDAALVTADDERALLVVVDGLGHGPEAAAVAERALAAVRGGDGDVTAIAHRCHEALAGTRGAAVSIGRFEGAPRTLTWAGVGNVEGRLVRSGTGPALAPAALLLADGVVGHDVPPLHPQVVPLSRGDVVVVATDGVDRSFADAMPTSGGCAGLAEGILRRHARSSDDALVLVARFLRGAS